MSSVFNASSLIAFLRNEPGAEAVRNNLLRDPASNYSHALNLCEVYYDFRRAASEEVAETAIDNLLLIGVQERNDLDSKFWREVGRLKAEHRRVSLADGCALALSIRLGAVLITADRHEFEPLTANVLCRIEFIR